MKLHRFFIDGVLEGANAEIKEKEIIHQITKVLRLGPEDHLLLNDASANLALVKIVQVLPDCIKADILNISKNESECGREVVLFCSILKRENFELVIQKATEAGVTKIIPLLCGRTVKTGFKKERLEKIIKEAAEQSGRAILPEISEPKFFATALEEAAANELNLFFDCAGEKSITPIQFKKIGVFIGPEGGWDEKETDLARQKGFQIMSLGKLTLRAETAAIVGSYLACNL